MKVVINKCFGGFGLSPRAVKRLAELNGRECYFFTHQREPYDFNVYEPISIEEADGTFMWQAFDIPNPTEVCAYPKDWHQLSSGSDVERTDPKLIQVVEELGSGHRTGASGQYAELAIVEIPDGTDYEIAEYDGREHIAERHQVWS